MDYVRQESITDGQLTATLFQGNALELLDRWGEVADCLVTDPPYKLGSGGKNGRSMGGFFSKENYSNDGEIVPCDIDWPDFMPSLYKCIGQGHAYIMANDKNLYPMLHEAFQAGFKLHNVLPWKKPSATQNKWYMKNAEFTGFFYKGKAKIINDCGSMQCVECAGAPNKVHPTQKPVALMQYYIENSTEPGELVIDPFMGAGTTAVAAIKSGRNFSGIEIDKEFFNHAHDRVTQAFKEPMLL